jgi:AcrR family transcriptional regulator
MTMATAGQAPRTRIGKAEQSQRTRALIIQTGIRCLAEHGYANTTMLLIAQQAGLSRGPLHYHFADHNALMAAIAEALPVGVSRGLMQRLMAAHDIEARLATIIDIALEEHLGAHHFAAMELLLAARNNTGLAAAIRPHFLSGEMVSDDWWCDYMALLRWPRADLIAFRRLFVACLRGLALDHLLPDDRETHAAALAMMRRMFLQFARPLPE